MTNARSAKTTREKAAELGAQARRDESRRRTLLVTAVVVAVLVVVVGAAVLVQVLRSDSETAKTAASAAPANLTDGGVLVGSSTAKVTIQVYEDFQCPACEQFESANAAQLTSWTAAGTARLIYHPISILDRYSTTSYSTRALNAAGAVVAADPAAFPAFHKLLYDNQPAENSAGLPDSQLIDYAVRAGVQRSAIESAITSQRYKVWTATTADAFSKAGYTGTPTIIVNGRQLAGFDPATLSAAVRAAQG